MNEYLYISMMLIVEGIYMDRGFLLHFAIIEYCATIPPWNTGYASCFSYSVLSTLLLSLDPSYWNPLWQSRCRKIPFSKKKYLSKRKNNTIDLDSQPIDSKGKIYNLQYRTPQCRIQFSLRRKYIQSHKITLFRLKYTEISSKISIERKSAMNGSVGTIGLAQSSGSRHIAMILISISRLMTGMSNSRKDGDRITIEGIQVIATMISLWLMTGSWLEVSIPSWSIDQNILRMSAMDTTHVMPQTAQMNWSSQSVRPMTSSWVRRGDPMMPTIAVSWIPTSRRWASISSWYRVKKDIISRFTI